MSTPIGACVTPANVTVGAGGGTVVFNPGTIANSTTDNAVPETLTIVYSAVVLKRQRQPERAGHGAEQLGGALLG